MVMTPTRLSGVRATLLDLAVVHMFCEGPMLEAEDREDCVG